MTSSPSITCVPSRADHEVWCVCVYGRGDGGTYFLRVVWMEVVFIYNGAYYYLLMFCVAHAMIMVCVV